MDLKLIVRFFITLCIFPALTSCMLWSPNQLYPGKSLPRDQVAIISGFSADFDGSPSVNSCSPYGETKFTIVDGKEAYSHFIELLPGTHTISWWSKQDIYFKTTDWYDYRNISVTVEANSVYAITCVCEFTKENGYTNCPKLVKMPETYVDYYQ